MHTWLRENVGPIASIRVQGQDHILVLTPEGAQQVFAADPARYEPYFKKGFTGVAGPASLWVLGGEAHRHERQLFAPAVRASHFSRHGIAIREIARSHLDKWQPGRTVRAFDTTLAISRDVIMRLVFGVQEAGLLAEGLQSTADIRHQAAAVLVPALAALRSRQNQFLRLGEAPAGRQPHPRRRGRGCGQHHAGCPP
jgi:cytochrome P450